MLSAGIPSKGAIQRPFSGLQINFGHSEPAIFSFTHVLPLHMNIVGLSKALLTDSDVVSDHQGQEVGLSYSGL